MKAYKQAICPVCQHKIRTTEVKADKDGTSKTLVCPKDGTPLKLSHNWYVRGRHNGEEIMKACGPKKSDAEDFIAACRLAKRAGTVLPGQEKDISWADAVKNCEQWWDKDVERKKMRPTTRTFYSYQLKALDRYFFGTSLLTITKSSIESAMDDMIQAGTAPATVCHAIKALKRMYTMHLSNLDLENTPRPKLMEKAFILSKVPLPEVDNVKTASCAPVDVQKVLELISNGKGSHASRKRLTLAIMLGVGMLMRPININSLEWSEVDMENGVIRISKDKMKGKRDFEQAIPAQILAALQEWKADQKIDSPFVFPSPADSQRPMTSMGKAISHWIKAAGLNQDGVDRKEKVTAYVLTRHTGATQLYEESGENLEMVSKTADHADSRITRKRYVKNRVEYAKRTVIPIQEAMLRRMVGK